MKRFAFIIVMLALLFVSCSNETDSSDIPTPSKTQSSSKDNNKPSNDLAESPVSDFAYKAIASGIEVTSYIGTSIRVRIPEKIESVVVTSIGDNSFEKRGIMELYFPNSVVNIGKSAFSGNTGLSNLIIPDGVTTIGDSAFADCTALTEIIIPDNVVNMGGGVFSGCTGLQSISIGDGVVSLDCVRSNDYKTGFFLDV